MTALATVRRVIVVNVKVTKAWESPNNAVLAAGVARYPNARLIDWHSVGSRRPGLFWDDRIHLRPEGARVYAELIAAALTGP